MEGSKKFCSGNFYDQKDLKLSSKKERHRLKQRDLGRRIGRISYSGQVFESIEPDTLWFFFWAGLRLNNAWASGTVLRPFLQPEGPLSSRSLVSGFKCKLRDSNSRPPYSRPRALTTRLYTIHTLVDFIVPAVTTGQRLPSRGRRWSREAKPILTAFWVIFQPSLRPPGRLRDVIAAAPAIQGPSNRQSTPGSPVTSRDHP